MVTMDAPRQIDKIAKMQQVLELLKDPEIFALVKALVTDGGAQASRDENNAPKESLPRGWRGSMAMTALRCVKHMNGEFTRRDLVEAVKGAGYEFIGRNPAMSMQRTLEKLLDEKAIRIVKPGAGRRPAVYERNDRRK